MREFARCASAMCFCGRFYGPEQNRTLLNRLAALRVEDMTENVKQEAQLPHRDSASAPHVFLCLLTDREIHWTPQLLYNYID